MSSSLLRSASSTSFMAVMSSHDHEEDRALVLIRDALRGDTRPDHAAVLVDFAHLPSPGLAHVRETSREILVYGVAIVRMEYIHDLPPEQFFYR